MVAITAPLFATHDPLMIDLDNNLAEPSAHHWLGTDYLGRDVYSRILYGGRQTIIMASLATLISIVGGLTLGVSGRYPPFKTILQSILDVWLALPSLLLALLVISLLGSGRDSIILAVGVANIGAYAHTTYDALQAQSNQPYIESAKSIGASPLRILGFHIIPNALPTLINFAGIMFSWALLNGAALSFLGFVVNPDIPDWGVMLASGRQTFAAMPYEALAAGIALTMTVGTVNLLTR